MADRTHQWNGATNTLPLPDYLVGGEYIMCGNDNRDNTSYKLDITVSEAALVYMLIDNRLSDGDGSTPPDFSTGSMSWLAENGWQPVTDGLNRANDRTRSDEVGVDEGGDGAGPGAGINQWSSVYVKRVPAGVVTILPADNNGQNMYGVVVTRIPKVVPARPVFAQPSRNGNALTLAWAGGGKLQEAANIMGPWTDVAGNPQNVATLSTTEPRKFHRLVVP